MFRTRSGPRRRVSDSAAHSSRSLTQQASRTSDETERLSREAQQTSRRECQPAERALGAAERASEDAAARVEEQRRRVERLQREGDQEGARRAQERLRQLETEANEARRATEARSERDRAARRCEDASSKADEARTRASDARAALAGVEAELAVLERRRDGTPQTISEPVYDTFHYDVRHVTRRCGGDVALTLDCAWSSQLQQSVAATPRPATTPTEALRATASMPISWCSREATRICARAPKTRRPRRWSACWANRCASTTTTWQSGRSPSATQARRRR